nr:MAG TPA: hypothetical protein [Caudoviricetes sp.]
MVIFFYEFSESCFHDKFLHFFTTTTDNQQPTTTIYTLIKLSCLITFTSSYSYIYYKSLY